VVGTIGNSLKILKDKVDRDLVPSFEIEPEPELSYIKRTELEPKSMIPIRISCLDSYPDSTGA
jgi:hypothetical protein